MKDHFEIVHHPNGGYAVVGQPDEESTVEATRCDRRFQSPYEALEYAGNLAARFAPFYSEEVRQDIMERGFHGRREWIR